MDIKDRVVVVTGGASGIGRSLVKAFNKHGAKHVVDGETFGQDESGTDAGAAANDESAKEHGED